MVKNKRFCRKNKAILDVFAWNLKSRIEVKMKACDAIYEIYSYKIEA